MGVINFLVIDVFVTAWSGYAAGFRSTHWRTSTSFHCAPVEGNSLQKTGAPPIRGRKKSLAAAAGLRPCGTALVLDVQPLRMECGTLWGCRPRFPKP